MIFAVIFVVLSAYLGLLFLFLTRRYFPRYYTTLNPQSAATNPYKLARQTSQLLSFAHAATLFMIILVPIIFVIIMLSASGDPEWNEKIPIQTRIDIDLQQLPAVDTSGLDESVIRGVSEITVRTTNYGIWASVMVTGELFGILMLFILLQARNLFVSVANGEFFIRGNVLRLRRCGIAVLVYAFGTVISHFLSWGIIVGEMSLGNDAFRLYPYLNFQPMTILVGISLLVFAGVLSEAVSIKEEQSMTV